MQQPLKDTHLVLGVTGGIAAYKACGILRRFQKAGCEIRVVMTAAAAKFVSRLTFETLSGNEVVTEMFPAHRMVTTRHISCAEWADAILVCPATANIVGKAAAGIADDFLSTLLMASRRPLIFAPAMDYEMIANPIYNENRKKLISFGHHFVDAESGYLASGAVGPGRLADDDTVYHRVYHVLKGDTSLAGKKVLITAGPTKEPIDPVRFLSNHSSGKMGYALARAARLRGADVTLISGPVDLAPVHDVTMIRVTTAAEMNRAVLQAWPDHNILVMSAAVADYTSENPSPQKIKKGSETIAVSLKRTDDILKNVSAVRKKDDIIVGFALETSNMIASGFRKLKEKNLDLICVNSVAEPGAGFASDTNHVTVLYPDQRQQDLGMLSKSMTADKIMEIVSGLRN